jgi:hypothetical protein
MNNTKNPLTSKTMWGGALTVPLVITAIKPIVVAILRAAGIEVGEPEVTTMLQQVGQSWEGVAGGVGIALVWYGRWKANAALSFRPPK